VEQAAALFDGRKHHFRPDAGPGTTRTDHRTMLITIILTQTLQFHTLQFDENLRLSQSEYFAYNQSYIEEVFFRYGKY
jgi:hypothetical protein